MSDGFDFDLGAFELVVGPINIWIESSEPRVSQDKVIFSYVSDIESLSELLLSLLDKEVAVVSDFPIFVHGAVDCINWFGEGEFLGP